MHIWLVQTGEELPIDPGPPRLWRTCQLAHELAERGHDVTYWSSSFNHQKKAQRVFGNTAVAGPGYRFRFLYGRPYRANMSLTRILSHRDNARSFEFAIRDERRPDVILCGFPLIELADCVATFASKHRIPFGLDCRDMWPDIFDERVPKFVRPLVRPLMAYWEAKRNQAFTGATAITGITDAFVRWGLSIARRAPSSLDRSFHLSAATQSFPADTLKPACAYWDSKLGVVQHDRLLLCFAGTMSERLDIKTAVRAIQLMPETHSSRVQLVLCGDGDSRSEIARMADGSTNIFVPGWVDAAHLAALLKRADAGLLPYPNKSDFLASYPNKVGEYLGAGLPIMTSLQGITKELLYQYGLALSYVYGDPASMRDLLVRTIDNLEAVRSQKNQALAAYKDHFDPDVIYPAFAGWLEAVAQESQDAS